MTDSPTVGGLYEIADNMMDGRKYHYFNIGEVVECRRAGTEMSKFVRVEFVAHSQNIRNEHVRSVDKDFTSIWR